MKGNIERFTVGLLGALLALGWPAAAYAAEPDKSGRVALPVVKIEKGEKCVEPTADMRRNHMNMILHQRDQTVHRGIRTTRHSLKNCVDCHANPKTNSVLGKDGFCASCHAYAAVRMDCFECHSPAPQKPIDGATPAAAYPPMSEQMPRAIAAPGRQAALALVRGSAP